MQASSQATVVVHNVEHPSPSPVSSLEERNRKLLGEFDAKFNEISHFFDGTVIKQHLIFLKALRRNALSIDQNFTVEHAQTKIKSPSPTFRVYLATSLFRYHIWITQCLPHFCKQGVLEKHEIPPFDVLAILHSHMLAPSRFNEDIIRKFSRLGLIGSFPFEQIVRMLIVMSIYDLLMASFSRRLKSTSTPENIRLRQRKKRHGKVTRIFRSIAPKCPHLLKYHVPIASNQKS
jgi:hypothetical protein